MSESRSGDSVLYNMHHHDALADVRGEGWRGTDELV